MGKYIDGSGLSHFMGILKGYFVPNTRTVNGHVLSSDVTVTKSDVGLGNVTNTKQAPEMHASSATTYGVADDELYGHVKLSDETNGLETAASGRTAATPKAVADALTSVANGYLANTSKVDGVGFVSGSATRYVVCGTAAGTATKEIVLSTCKDYSVIPTGTVVYVEFTNTNTAAVANLAFQAKGPVSGSSGNSNIGSAAGIKYRGANLPSAGTLAANRIYTFVYDGTNWELIGDLDTTVSKTTTTPKMNGTAAVGSETKYAAGDHVHPTDTTRFAAADFTAVNIVTAIGNEPVARATADGSGNKITSTYAKLASPALTGTPTAPTAAAGTNNTQIATTAFVANAVGTATAGALQYKGTVSQESTITGASYKKGWYYVVATAGTYVGKVCEVGDMLIAKQDKTSTPANDWDAVQSNIEVLSNSEIDTLWAAA